MADPYIPQGVGLKVVPLDKLIQQQLDADNSLMDSGKGSNQVEITDCLVIG